MIEMYDLTYYAVQQYAEGDDDDKESNDHQKTVKVLVVVQWHSFVTIAS